jgi:glycerophosphoryl diester phosphodiesterase
MASSAISKPIIVHHMGAFDGQFPPNSLEAIRSSLEFGARFIEVDITALASGDYLLVHDPDMESETTGHGPVASTQPQVARNTYLKAHNGEPSSCNPALLSEVVALFNQFSDGARLQLDFKNVIPMTNNEPLERLVQLIQPLGDRVIVSTGADWQLRRLHQIAPWLELGFDVHYYVDWRLPHDPIDPRVPPFKKGAYGYWDDHILATERHWSIEEYLQDRCESLMNMVPYASTFYIDHKMIAQSLDDGFNWAEALHHLGVKLDAWTLDIGDPVAEQNVIRLLEAGVDYLTTNTPRELAKQLAQ